MEHQLDLVYRQESDLKAEISKLQSVCQQNADEIRRLEHLGNKIRDDAATYQQQKEESERLINKVRSHRLDSFSIIYNNLFDVFTAEKRS